MIRDVTRRHHAGFTMIELLVSLLILLVGLLGMAGLQTRTQHAEMESYQRAQALILTQDIVDRLNANREVADCYVIASIGTGYTGTPGCTAGTLEQQGRANADLTAWNSMLLGASETSNGTNTGAMIGARGCITSIGASQYLVTVVWQGVAPTAAPAQDCGQGLYGDDNLRRAISIPVTIGDLI